jgi:hypothetical protein
MRPFWLCRWWRPHLVASARKWRRHSGPTRSGSPSYDNGAGDRAEYEVAQQMVAFHRRFPFDLVLVLLLFALVNAGVMIRGFGTGTKPLGVLASIGLAVACGLRLPHGVGWRDLVVIACTSSIGLAYALFFAAAAVPPGPVLVQPKLGALLSVAGALVAIAAGATLHVGRFTGDGRRRARRRREPIVEVAVASSTGAGGVFGAG